MTFYKTRFCADFIDERCEERYEGFTQGQRWNGWATPYFTKQVVLDIIAKHPEFYMRFDEERNGVWAWEDFGQGDFPATEPSEGNEEWSFYKCVVIDFEGLLIPTYAVGAWCWCWNEESDITVPEPGLDSVTQSRTLTVKLRGDFEKFEQVLGLIGCELCMNIGGGTHDGVKFTVEYDEED